MRPKPTPLIVPLVVAARGTMQLALRDIATDRYYAEFLRPGVGPVFGATAGTNTPACNAVTDSASQTFASQNGSQTLLTFATYPAGDSTCSMSPNRIIVLQITSGSPVTTANGYQFAFALTTDPIVAPGSIAGFEQIQAAWYSAVDGSADVESRIEEAAAQPPGLTAPAQPAPGTFPATFPTGLPTPPPLTSAFGPSAYYATVENGASSTTGSATAYSDYTTSSGNVGNLGTLDTLHISAAPPLNGIATLASSDSSPEYAVDFGAAQAIVVQPSSFPLPAGSVAETLEPLSSLGLTSSPLNFPSSAAGSAAFGASGELTACGVTYIDQANAVSTSISCNADETMNVVVTDLLRHAAATSPSPILLDASGTSNPFTYLLDGTTDIIGNFHIQQPQD